MSYGHSQPFPQPLSHSPPLSLELLRTGTEPYSVASFTRAGVVEGKPKEVDVLFLLALMSKWEHSCLVRGQFETELSVAVSECLHDRHRSPFDYIVAQSIDRLSAETKEKIFREDNWDQVFVARDSSETFKVKTIKQSSAPELDNEIIVTWSAKRQAHDLKVLTERFEKCKQLLDKGTRAVDASIKHDVRQFLRIKKGAKVEYAPNDDLYQKRKKQAGYYALVTSHKNTDVMQIYRDLRRLWHIEECFRVMKANLDTRPVYVGTPKRIRGHFLVCYLALVMERLRTTGSEKSVWICPVRRSLSCLRRPK